MKKFALLIIAVFLFIISGKIVNAIPAAPSPTCEIKAKVEEIEENKNIPFNYAAYAVKLKEVRIIRTIKQEGTQKCDNEYVINIEQSSLVLPIGDYLKKPISAGDSIKANTHFGGDDYLGGYFLSDIEKIDIFGRIYTDYIVIIGIAVLVIILIIMAYFFGRKSKK